jgi:hypothetical protein
MSTLDTHVVEQKSDDADCPEQSAADQIMRHRTYAGRHFDPGDFVALLGDEVIAIGRSYETVAAALSAREPDRTRGMICLVSDVGPDVVR